MSDPIQRAEPEFVQKRPNKKRSVFWRVSSLFLLLLLTAVAIPKFVKARGSACKNSCINNLRQIRQAKESWALANKKSAGETATIQDVARLMTAWPKCPGGGSYTLGNVGEEPRCSLPEHYLTNPQNGAEPNR